MQYQGAYPEEAKELKQEYKKEVAKIKEEFAPTAAPSLLLIAGTAASKDQEKRDLKEAKENYKMQMEFQGAYPDEAKELKQEYKKEVAKVKEEFAPKAAPALLLAAGVAAPQGQELLLAGVFSEEVVKNTQ